MLNPTDAVQPNNNNTPSLQPMRFSEILDTTFSLYRKHFLLFLGVLAPYFRGSLIQYSLEGFLANHAANDLIANLVNIPFALIGISGIIVGAGTIYLGRDITSTDALKQAIRSFWKLLVCQILWSLVLVVPLLTLSFAGSRGVSLASMLLLPSMILPFSIYFVVRWAFLLEIVLLEKSNIHNAFRRSSELVRSTWWRVFAVSALIMCLGAAIHFILEISIGSILISAKVAGGTDLRNLIQWSVTENDLHSSNWVFYAVMICTNLVLKTLTTPIWVIGIVLLYFDQRIRKEGFDLELQINAPHPVPDRIQE